MCVCMRLCNASMCGGCASLSVGICVTSAASFWLFHYTPRLCKRPLDSLYLWPILGAWLSHEWRTRSSAHRFYKAVSKWRIFQTIDLENSFTGVPVAQWRCSLCVCCCFSVSLFVWAWLCDVRECLHGTFDNFHRSDGFRPRHPVKVLAEGSGIQSWLYILYDCHLRYNFCS